MKPIFDLDMWPYAILRFEPSYTLSDDDITEYFASWTRMYEKQEKFSLLIQAEHLDNVSSTLMMKQIVYLAKTHMHAKEYLERVGIWCPNSTVEARMNKYLNDIRAIYTPSSDIKIAYTYEDALAHVAGE